jgi:hypothetical protein
VVDQDVSLKAKLLELKDANGKTFRDLMTDEGNTELASYLEGKEDIILEQSYLESAKSAVTNFFGGWYEPVNNTAGSLKNTTSELIAPIETNNVLQHTQYAAVETFAKSTPLPRVITGDLKDTTKLIQRLELANANQNKGPIKGCKATKHKKAIKGVTKEELAEEVLKATKALKDANDHNFKHEKAADFATKASGYLKVSVLASQSADTVENVAYFLGYENSQIVRNSHDVLKIGSGLAISYASGNKGVLLSSALQTHVVENGIKSIESSYQLNSFVVDGIETAIGTAAAYLLGGVPYAVASLAFSGANIALNAAIENQYIESNGLVTSVQAALTFVPQIAGAYYNPYKIGKVLAGFHIVKTASEFGLIGYVKDHTIGNITSDQAYNNTAEVISYGANKAFELVGNHPFGTGAVAIPLITKLSYATKYQIGTPIAVALTVSSALLDIAYLFNTTQGAIIGGVLFSTIGGVTGGAIGSASILGSSVGASIGAYLGFDAGIALGGGAQWASNAYPELYNTTVEFVQNHPGIDGAVGAGILSGSAYVLSKYAALAKVAGAVTPVAAAAILPLGIFDVAYQNNVLEGAGIGAGALGAAGAVIGGAYGGASGAKLGGYLGFNAGIALGGGTQWASNAYPEQYNTTVEFGRSHPIGGLAVGAGFLSATMHVLSNYAVLKVAAVAIPFFNKFTLPLFIADVANYLDAKIGAGAGATVLGVGSLALGAGIPAAFLYANVGAAAGIGLELLSEQYPDQYNNFINAVSALPFSGATVGPVEDIGVINRELGQFNLNKLLGHKSAKVATIGETIDEVIARAEATILLPVDKGRGVGAKLAENWFIKNDVKRKSISSKQLADVKTKLGEAKLVKYSGLVKAASKFADIVPDLLYLSKKAGYEVQTSYTYNNETYSAVPNVVDGIKLLTGLGMSALTGNHGTFISAIPQMHYSALPFEPVKHSIEYLNNIHWSATDVLSGVASAAVTYYLSSNPVAVAVNVAVYGSSIGLKALVSNGYVDPENKVVSYGQAGLEVAAQVMNAATSSSTPVKLMTAIQVLCTLDSNDITVGNIIASDASQKTIGAISYTKDKVAEVFSWDAFKDTVKGHMFGINGGLFGVAALGIAKTSYFAAGVVSAEIVAPATISYDAYSHGYNTIGGVFGGLALGAAAGALLGAISPGVVLGATVLGIIGAIGGGVAEYGNNEWYYTISDDSKYPILQKHGYSATDIFNLIKDTTDTDVNQNYDVRQSYNEHIAELYKDVYSNAIREIRCQGGDITEDMAREASELRSELESIHFYATSMAGKALINARNLVKYKALELDYDYYHNNKKSDEDIFYGAFKSGGGDLGLENNGFSDIVKLSKQIRKAAADEKMKKAHPEFITNKAAECFVEQYASNPNDDIVKMFGECAKFLEECPA